MTDKLTIENALKQLRTLSEGELTIAELWASKYPGIPFRESKINKGGLGQITELLIGMNLGSSLKDFADGELKTSGTLLSPDGSLKPKETMAITTISKQVDNIVYHQHQDFEASTVFEKTKDFIYQPVVQPSKDRATWYFHQPIRITLHQGSEPYETLKKDYNDISKRLLTALDEGGRIHTISGDYIQIRSKDGKDPRTGTYHPVYSEYYQREVANKNHAFYFKKKFLIDALENKFN